MRRDYINNGATVRAVCAHWAVQSFGYMLMLQTMWNEQVPDSNGSENVGSAVCSLSFVAHLFVPNAAEITDLVSKQKINVRVIGTTHFVLDPQCMACATTGDVFRRKQTRPLS